MIYYDRKPHTRLDGTPMFKSEVDERNEREVAQILAPHWDCEMHSFGQLSPIDWWVERNDHMIGLAELKARTHTSTKYDSVYLNVRKWLSLTTAQTGLGVPAIFAARFTDGVLKYISVNDIDASRHVMGGCKRFVKSRNDREPVIEVPIDEMRLVKC